MEQNKEQNKEQITTQEKWYQENKQNIQLNVDKLIQQIETHVDSQVSTKFQPIDISLMDLHTIVYNCCTTKQGELKLYTNKHGHKVNVASLLYEYHTELLTNYLLEKLENFKNIDLEKLEFEKKKIKMKYDILAKFLKQCFGYLDRYFVIYNKLSDLKTKSTQLYEKIILS